MTEWKDHTKTAREKYIYGSVHNPKRLGFADFIPVFVTLMVIGGLACLA